MNPNTLCMSCMQDDSGNPVCPKCGAPFDLPPKNTLQLKPRTVLREQYVIGRALGHGGFGVTYLAWDIGLQTRLAVKEYLPNGVAGRASGETKVLPYSQQAQPEFEWGLERFLEEARTLKKFSRFPGIVSVDTIFRDNGTAYLVMEYLDGWTLEEFLKRRGGKITFETALRVMVPVIDALSAVHADGILHRDISPDNILLTRDGKVKLIDFGAARNALSQKSRMLSIILKEGYAPEEQYRAGGIQGPWTDVYAAAATIYHVITGVRPESALDRLAGSDLRKPSELGIDIDPDGERALMLALSLRAADRFQSMEDFKAALTGSASITAIMKAFNPEAPLGGPIAADAGSAWERKASAVPASVFAPSIASTMPTAPMYSPPIRSSAPTQSAAPLPPPPSISQHPIPPPPSMGPRWVLAATLVLIALIAIGAGIVFLRPKPVPPIATASLPVEAPQPVHTSEKPQPDNPTPDRSSPNPAADNGTLADPKPTEPANSPAPIPRPSRAEPSPIAPSPISTSPTTATPVDRPPPVNPSSPTPSVPGAVPNPSAEPTAHSPGDYGSLIDQSKVAWDRGQFPLARMLLNQAINLDPNRPRAYTELAELNLYVLDNAPNAKRNAHLAIDHGGEAIFRVLHDHSGETFAVHGTGKLHISATELRYVPESDAHGFTAQKSELREVRRNHLMGVGIGRQKPTDLHPFHIRLGNGQNYNFAGTSKLGEPERALILELLGKP
jgi:serine/threonine protein kinase